MTTGRWLAAAAVGGGLILPAGAHAAAVQVLGGTCFREGQQVPIGGTGFTPNRPVTVAYAGRTTTFLTDAAGNFVNTFQAPVSESRSLERDYTLTATDSANPANVVRTTFKGTEFTVSVSPRRAVPSRRVLFRLGGFTPGTTVYAHYVFRGRHIRTVGFGTAQAPCGTITARRRSLPARTRYGRWKVQFDGRRSYSRTTVPRIEANLNIFRRVR